MLEAFIVHPRRRRRRKRSFSSVNPTADIGRIASKHAKNRAKCPAHSTHPIRVGDTSPAMAAIQEPQESQMDASMRSEAEDQEMEESLDPKENDNNMEEARDEPAIQEEMVTDSHNRDESSKEQTDSGLEDDESRPEATFSFTVPNISKLKETVLSPPCYIRNLPWKIMVCSCSFSQMAPQS